MHRYRSAARHSAWNDDNMNPFRKIHSRIHDGIHTEGGNGEESGLRVRSETHITPSMELNRRTINQESYQGPIKSSSMPHAYAGMGTSSSNIGDTNLSSEPIKESQDSEPATDDTVVAEEPSINQPRRRKPGFMKFFSKKKQRDEEMQRTTTMDSKKTVPHQFTFVGQLKATIFNSYINVLLIMAPVGIAVYYAHINPIAVFVINFIAIIPLAAMLSYATEEIAYRVGDTIGGLLNATFGNAVELIVSIIALAQNQILIVQTSLIGSMLSNLLLVMGMCFFFGGINRVEQHFNVTVAQTASSLLALAVASLIIPGAYVAFSSANNNQTSITELSRGTSVLLLFVYGCYLFFQLKTHASMYNEPSPKVEKRRTKVEGGDATKGMAQIGAGISASMGGQNAQETPMLEPEDKPQPQLSLWVAIFTLGISTAIIALCAEYMVDSINYLTDEGGISKTFVGLILLPIVGNAAEHATAVTVACKDKMDLAIGVAVGSSMQVALLVIPFVVILGWIMGNDMMTLQFDGFQIAILFVSVLLVNYLIQDGKSHWLEGILLQILYMIIAIAAWFYPSNY